MSLAHQNTYPNPLEIQKTFLLLTKAHSVCLGSASSQHISSWERRVEPQQTRGWKRGIPPRRCPSEGRCGGNYSGLSGIPLGLLPVGGLARLVRSRSRHKRLLHAQRTPDVEEQQDRRRESGWGRGVGSWYRERGGSGSGGGGTRGGERLHRGPCCFGREGSP